MKKIMCFITVFALLGCSSEDKTIVSCKGNVVKTNINMAGEIAKRFDNESVLESNIQPNDILELINEEYGISDYGSVKYKRNEIYWIGYIYRYFAFTYDISSAQVYKIVKPKELRGLFLAYHTLDPAQAIERILEAKGMLIDEEEELKRQYEIFRRIRKNNN